MADMEGEEPMDFEPYTSCERSEQPSTASECSEQPSTSYEDIRTAQVTLSIKWSGDSPPQKSKLEMALVSWATKKYNGNCIVVNIRGGTAVIEFEPAPDLSDLQELCGQTLEIKDKIKNSVQIIYAIVKPPNVETEIPDNTSEPQDDKRKAQVTLSIKWSGNSPLQKTKLEKALQYWTTKKYNGNCRVVNIRGGTAVIEFEPAPALNDLQELCGQTLEIKDMIKNSVHPVKIMCVSLNPPYLETEIPDNTSEPQDGELHLRKQSCFVDFYRAPVPEPQRARDPPNTLLQKIADYSESNFSVKSKDQKKLMDELKINQKKERKLLHTVSFDRMAVHQPSQSRDAIKKSVTNINTPRYYIRYNEAPIVEGATAAVSEEDNCPICMDRFKNKKQLQCKHEFCEECLTKAKESMGAICPICKDVFGKVEGDQPPGTMKWREGFASLAGFSGCGSIIITYDIPSGTQTEKHPHPGKSYYGCSRQAFLPNNKEGKEVLQLLKRAFYQKLIFTVGTSRTTGREDQVIWDSIHHKTSETGGPQGFGYPDPNYLSRVREELKAKGIE